MIHCKDASHLTEVGVFTGLHGSNLTEPNSNRPVKIVWDADPASTGPELLL